MSWYERILRRPGHARDATRLLKLRATRFRQLIRNYGRLLDIIDDAADKQDGDYIFDRQYVVSLSEVVIDLADAVVFDLNVLTDQRCRDFYDALDRLRMEARASVTPEDDPGDRSHDEPVEYRILRRLRQAMLTLSLGENGGSGAVLEDCKTAYDLVHLAHELAGEGQRALVADQDETRGMDGVFMIGVDTPVRVLDVGDGIEQTRAETSLREAIRSAPLRALVDGMDQAFRRGAASWPRVAPASLAAVITEDHVHAVVDQPAGFDLVDATAMGSKAANHVYCRFASALRGSGGGGLRGGVAGGILSRLGFSTVRTARAAVGFLRTIPRAEAEERLAVVGRLAAFMLARDAAGWGSAPRDAHIDAFMTQHT